MNTLGPEFLKASGIKPVLTLNYRNPSREIKRLDIPVEDQSFRLHHSGTADTETGLYWIFSVFSVSLWLIEI